MKLIDSFAFSASQLAAAREYVSNQEEHHKQTSFKDEYRAFLERHKVEYDERYAASVWKEIGEDDILGEPVQKET